MTTETRYVDELTDDEQSIVIEAMDAIEIILKGSERMAGDDRLWRVENALARYMIETRSAR